MRGSSMAERRVISPDVAGSIPARAAIGVSSVAERWSVRPDVAGSIPAPRTTKEAAKW